MWDYFAEIIQAGSPVLVLLAGLAIGIQHAFEPDHVAAMTNQMVRRKSHGHEPVRGSMKKTIREASIAGALWGAGHTAGIFVMGLVIAVFSLGVSDGVFSVLEFVVGMMLILLGILSFLNRGILVRGHVHPHSHADGVVHTHRHDHGGIHGHGHGSYIIGCIHGLAGSGILVALLASGLNGVETVFYFLAMFGVGSIAGMILASGIIGIPLAASSGSHRMQKICRYAMASIAIIIGAVIIHQMTTSLGFVSF